MPAPQNLVIRIVVRVVVVFRFIVCSIGRVIPYVCGVALHTLFARFVNVFGMYRATFHMALSETSGGKNFLAR
jgi:hypothetical protein